MVEDLLNTYGFHFSPNSTKAFKKLRIFKSVAQGYFHVIVTKNVEQNL